MVRRPCNLKWRLCTADKLIQYWTAEGINLIRGMIKHFSVLFSYVQLIGTQSQSIHDIILIKKNLQGYEFIVFVKSPLKGESNQQKEKPNKQTEDSEVIYVPM